MPANRLIKEKSPYLLQHAHNPVDWYPWGEEAFTKAARENKPVFLSIGYSTCHWCHVMERESFEDEEVARMLNSAFISIKVDREERPDIDGIYMSVCQMLTGSGGWPLTIFMTPEKKPFFAGTYFPKDNRYGRSGITDILTKINDIWNSRQDEIDRSADEITSALNKGAESGKGASISIETLEKTFTNLSRKYDSLHGGFGNAPKFPAPHNLLFLLRYGKRTGEERAREMVGNTLIQMRKGGIYDHAGYGFHRYSTDRKWLVPHFEKMLYDQALIAAAYTEAFQESNNLFFKETAGEIIDYVLRDMTSEEGGFYSAEDADSEGVEGKFYLWTEEEVKSILGNEADIFIRVFGIKKEGNWVDPLHGYPDGTNILHLDEEMSVYAEELGFTESELKNKTNEMLRRLFEIREKRIHPHKDDKILTDWNALMISALAKSGAALGNSEYIQAAEKCTRFILSGLLKNGHLLHRYRKGEAGLSAYLDDYAFFIAALIDLYEAVFNPEYLKKAVHFTDLVINHFLDKEGGGFFFTSSDNEELIARQKDLYDGAIPSGNSVMIVNLFRLGRITGNHFYEKEAIRTAETFGNVIQNSPAAFTYTASALEFALGGSYEVIISGSPEEAETKNAVKALNESYIPNKIVLLNSPDDKEIKEVSPFLNSYPVSENQVTIYVCRDYRCSLPVHTAGEMMSILGKQTAGDV